MFRPHAVRTMDMTTGALVTKVLFFSLPIMISGILQLVFNAADTIVVGQVPNTYLNMQGSLS